MQKSGKPATSRTKVRADKWSHGKADLMKTTDWLIPMYYYHSWCGVNLPDLGKQLLLGAGILKGHFQY